jgi:DNA-directed RNA polymerase subunit RPC12/RpoP
MAILDLDKILIRKQHSGIACIYCGGDLIKTDKPKLIGKIISWLTLGKIKTGHFRCENCKKKFTIL